jgi:AraC-like DNA-binding protein
MDSQTIHENRTASNDSIHIEYMCSDCHTSRTIAVNSRMLCYVINGRCSVDGQAMGRDMERNSLYVLNRGDHHIDMRPEGDLSFEQLMIHVPEDVTPTLSGFDAVRMDREVLAAISEHVNLNDLAARCCVSLSTFKRHFRTRYSMSPHRWLHAQRMRLAYRLIVDTELSISDISSRCGYTTPTHFTTLFRTFHGITPGQLRRQHRKALR